MKSRIVLGAMAVLALGAGLAKGHETQFVSELVIEDGDFVKGHGFAYGFVASKANPKCIGNREVKLRAATPGPYSVIDEAKTSKNGGFYVFGQVPKNAIALDVKMPKTDLNDSGTKVCSGDTVFISTVP